MPDQKFFKTPINRVLMMSKANRERIIVWSTVTSIYNINFYIFLRSLGRRPSEDKVSLYLRKPSSSSEAARSATSPPKEQQLTTSVNLRTKTELTSSKSQGFLEDMARRSLEVPTGFLNSISSPKLEDNSGGLAKKYPFHRTTTPNSLREQLKETLAKNLGSCTDLAETIQSIKDDEILDTFNIDSENIETPPVQRRAFRHRSFRLSGSGGGGDEDQESDIGSDFASRRRNHKFRTLAGDGRPLGDRELVIKKKRESTTDLSTAGGGGEEAAREEEEGPGLFDRFSSARKTLTRGSQRRKKESGGEEEGDGDAGISLELESGSERKQNGGAAGSSSKDSSTWRTKLASRFKKNSTDSYDLVEAAAAAASSPGQELRNYLSLAGSSAPATEPTRRKPLLSSLHDNGHETNSKERISRGSAASLAVKKDSGGSNVASNGRKSSYILPGDYDSELVDGRYVTSVPIISVEEGQDLAPVATSGNLRPGHLALKDLKPADAAAATNRKSSLMERLARTASVQEPLANNRPLSSASNSNVFDRLASSAARSASRTSLVSTSAPSARHSGTLSPETRTASNSSLRAAGSQEKPRGTLNKIKDITKSLRKNKEEPMMGSSSSSVIRPRNSQAAFASGSLPERKPMSSINGGSHPSISSSTRSLNRSTFSSGKDSVRRSNPTIGGSGRTSSSTFTRSGGGLVSLKSSNSSSSLVKAPAGSGSMLRNGKGLNGGSTTSGTAASKSRPSQHAATTSSKENLSRSSSSASRSSITNSTSNVSRAGSLRTAVTAAAAVGAVPLNGSSSSLASARLVGNRTAATPLIRSAAANGSRPMVGGGGAGLSFMKPTAASAKKVLVTPTNSDASVSRKAVGRTVTTTSSRVVPISAKPSRR